LAALALTLLVLLHGASFLSNKTTGEIEQKSRELVRWLWLLVTLMLVIFLVTSFIVTGVSSRLNVVVILFPVLGILAMLAAGFLVRKRRFGYVFLMTCLTIAFFVLTIFSLLYPNVIVSSLNPAWNLTIQNASSSTHTLRLMTIVTLIFLPIVLLYQIWSYWIFRKRLTGDVDKLTY
jgi:cytochrome d ubiquinol oxidase subunit II